jgi:hypothetical protein
VVGGRALPSHSSTDCSDGWDREFFTGEIPGVDEDEAPESQGKADGSEAGVGGSCGCLLESSVCLDRMAIPERKAAGLSQGQRETKHPAEKRVRTEVI